MNHPTTPARADKADGLAGLRVLFLPKNSRTAYFQSLLATARTRKGWQVSIVCSNAARRLWRDAAAGEGCFHSVPDFNERQAWEDDPDRVAEIDRAIAECEQATGISAGRILLAGERDLGRGYSRPIYHWVENRTARRVLGDNTEPFRILRRMFAFAFERLDSVRPDALLAGEWADPLCFTFHLAARARGIPCVVNRYSKIWSGRCFWSAQPLMYNEARDRKIAGRRRDRVPVSDRARQHIQAFREQPKMIAYVRANWDRLEQNNWLRRHMDMGRTMLVGARDRIRGEGANSKPGLQLLMDHYRRPWLEWRNALYFRRFGGEALTSLRYIYLALHKDPEQTLNYQAPYWTYQMYTVGLLSSCLPYGYKLLVREHRANAARRPPRFYKDMSALPGVVLIDGYDDQFKYIRHADLIVTENGSSGLEGLLLGRRVITLADTFYDGTDLELRVHDPEQLATKVVEFLEEEPVKDPTLHDQALGWLLDAEWETSAPTDSADHVEAFDLLNELLEHSVSSRRQIKLQTA